MTWDIFNKAILFIGAVVGIIYTLRQLWDKKPRLRVDFERDYFPHPSGHTPSGSIAHPTPKLTIKLRNLTERTINIEKTCFVDAKKQIFVVPSNWKTVSEIPAHDYRTFVVSVPEFEKWTKNSNIIEPEKGRFVLDDATGRQHKSMKIKKWISMAPTKLP